MIINFDALKQKDAELFKLSAAYSGCKSGDHKLDQSMFPADVWERLVAFVNKPEEQRPDPSVRMREDSQRAAAAARIEQLQEEQGLLDNEANAKLIGNYFRDHKLAFSVANINEVVLHVLRANLAWAPKLKVAAVVPPAAPPAAAPAVVPAPVAPTPAPAPAAEVLGLVAGTNETQLPLESSEYVLRRASKTQVADWLSRKRAVTGKYLRPRGSWGTSL